MKKDEQKRALNTKFRPVVMTGTGWRVGNASFPRLVVRALGSF